MISGNPDTRKKSFNLLKISGQVSNRKQIAIKFVLKKKEYYSVIFIFHCQKIGNEVPETDKT